MVDGRRERSARPGVQRRSATGHSYLAVRLRGLGPPGGYKYSFQHYDPDSGQTLLRYDNAHEHPVAGWHHRHVGGEEPEPIDYESLDAHLRRFRRKVVGDDD